jgi:hypothetical protein
MDFREREGSGATVNRVGSGERATPTPTQVSKAEADLARAMKAGRQRDADNEARRQFCIGHATGVLGLVRSAEVMLTARRR